MSIAFTCDACGKADTGTPVEQGVHAKPVKWWERPTPDPEKRWVIQHACSLECREKLNDAGGRILVTG